MNTKRDFRQQEAARVRQPIKARATSTAAFLPARLSLPALRAAAAGCTGCELYKRATQTVFGEGPRNAPLVFVGEQPGDQEDLQGHPFVGPAGKLLASALAQAGISREAVYITNAVKHFKWTARGKRRLHERPREGEIDACRPWLLAELKVVKPRVLVCLGTTAARSAFGHIVRLKDYRGRFSESELSSATFVTIHPSAILRLREPERTREYNLLVDDLKQLRRYLSD